MPSYGYKIRKTQIELAGHIFKSLSRRIITLAEAEIGTGKTHAYLIAAALIKTSGINDTMLRSKYPLTGKFNVTTSMPVVISTSSIALQNAVVKEYIPTVSRILMEGGIIETPLSGIVRKGKEHYLCELRFNVFLQDSDNRTRRLLRDISGKGINPDKLEGIPRSIIKSINVSRDCSSSCPGRGHCRYIRFLEQSRLHSYDFQVCNHQYLLADVSRRANGQSPLIPHYQAIIIDEAHKLRQSAEQIYGSSIGSSDIPQALGSFSVAPPERIRQLTRVNTELFSILRSTAEKNHHGETDRLKTKINSRASLLLSEICHSLEWLADKQPDSHALWALKDLIQRVWAFRGSAKIIHRIEFSGAGEAALSCIPQNLDRRLYNDLWSRGIPTVLTSGTLTARGSFERSARQLGLSKVREGGLTTTAENTSKPL